MRSWIILAAALAAINPVCDLLVDWHFKQVHSEPAAYTASDRSGMKRLLDKALAKKTVSHTEAMTVDEQAVAIIGVFGGDGR
jgi:hypothetical protein